MLAGILHSGSGLGNQLFRYVATRVLAYEKWYDFTMVAPENFKGKGFMNLEMHSKPVGGYPPELAPNYKIPYHTKMPEGKVIPTLNEMNFWEEGGNQYYNPEFNFIEDNTIIDGEFQDS